MYCIGTHTPARDRAGYTHTHTDTHTQSLLPSGLLRSTKIPPGPAPHPLVCTNTRGDRRTAGVGKLHKTQSIDTRTSCTQSLGRSDMSTLLYPKFRAESPSTPTARRTPAPASPQLTPPAPALDHKRRWAGPGRTGPSGAGSQAARRPGGPRRPGSAKTGVRPGPLASCPSAGPRGQASSPWPPLPASGPRSPAAPCSPLFACVPVPGLPHCLPTREARAPGNGEGASSPCACPQPVPARRYLCCGADREGAGPAAASSSPSPAPAPFPAGPGPETLPRRTYLLAPRGAVRRRPRPLGAPGREGRGRGGSRGSPSAADRAPPAAGEGAGRVSAGRHWEEGNGLG